jgi:large subunit ribosomal protein L1
METKQLINALKRMRSESKKRKFEQSVDFTINFRGIDFKKASNQIDVDVKMPHSTGRIAAAKTLVFVKDKGFAEQIKKKVDRVILDEDIPALKKKDAEEIIANYNVVLAEGSSILSVAKYLGQQLAPRGKMPKSITQSIAAIDAAVANASTSVKVSNKKGKFMPLVHVTVGKENDKDEKILDNISAVYDAVVPVLPNKVQNVKSMYVKLTMGPPIKVGEEMKVEGASQ